MRCAACGAVGPGALTFALASRSLPALLDAYEKVAAGESADAPPCPGCGSVDLRIDRMMYEWDEPLLPALEYDAERGLTCDGERVEGEEDLVRIVGRPFSPAAYHRILLTPQKREVVYQPSPGVVTCALREPKAGDVDAVQLAARHYRGAGETHVGLVEWAHLETSGPGLWLGPSSQALHDGDLNLISLVEMAYLREQMVLAAEEATFRVESVDDDAVHVRWEDIRVALRVQDAATRTVTVPATVREACVIVANEAARACHAVCGALVRLGDIVETVQWADEPMRAQITTSAGADVVDFGAYARRFAYDEERIAESLRLYLSVPNRPPAPGEPRACGCQPVLTVTVRSARWAVEHTERLLFEPMLGDLAACYIEDCDHLVRYVQADEMTVEQARLGARADADKTRYQVFMHPVRSITGEVTGFIVYGHNVAGVAWDDRLARGLAAAAGLQTAEFALALVTSELVCLSTPECDIDLLRLELGHAEQALGEQRVALGERLQGVFTFTAAGDRAGQFDAAPM